MRELLGALLNASGDGWTVADLEAGLENLARATPRHVTTLLVVLEPYFKSLETGRRIHELARELEIPRVIAVANKVHSPDEEEAIRRFCASHGIELAGIVPHDEAIGEADLQGRSVVDLAPGSPAVQRIRELAARFS